MESAGKEDTPEDAERKGLGTTATRAGIIEKLISAGFAERKGKKLIPTKDGYNLVAILPDSLTSPQLTAEWETRLTGIAKGSDSPADFMRGIEEMTAGLGLAAGGAVVKRHLLPVPAFVVPAGQVNFVRLVSAAWQADTLAVFIKVIFLLGLCRPCAALVKGAHGKHDVTMGIALAGVVNGIINAHSSGNKLRGTVFPDKSDLFLSG